MRDYTVRVVGVNGRVLGLKGFGGLSQALLWVGEQDLTHPATLINYVLYENDQAMGRLTKDFINWVLSPFKREIVDLPLD